MGMEGCTKLSAKNIIDKKTRYERVFCHAQKVDIWI